MMQQEEEEEKDHEQVVASDEMDVETENEVVDKQELIDREKETLQFILFQVWYFRRKNTLRN
jgi:hypothetical protein